MMRFFLKTRRKKCRGLAILLSDFAYLGHVTCEIIAFFTSHLIPTRIRTYLDICSFFLKIQHIIFLSTMVYENRIKGLATTGVKNNPL